MRNPIIQALESEQLKTNIPEFSPGDTVVVQVIVKEGERVRSDDIAIRALPAAIDVREARLDARARLLRR